MNFYIKACCTMYYIIIIQNIMPFCNITGMLLVMLIFLLQIKTILVR